jgi:hypothetical protein
MLGSVVGLALSSGLSLLVSKSPYLQSDVVLYAGGNYARDGLLLTLINPQFNLWFWIVGTTVGASAGLHLSAMLYYLSSFDIEVSLIFGTYAVCSFGGFVAYLALENVISLRDGALDLFYGASSAWTLSSLLLSLLAAIGFGEFGGVVCGAYSMGFFAAYVAMYHLAIYIGLWTCGLLFVAFCGLSAVVQFAANWWMSRSYSRLPELSDLDKIAT